MRLGWRTTGADSVKLATNCEFILSTQENFRFSICGCYVQQLGEQNRYRLVWAVMINPPEMPIKKCAHLNSAMGAILHRYATAWGENHLAPALLVCICCDCTILLIEEFVNSFIAVGMISHNVSCESCWI